MSDRRDHGVAPEESAHLLRSWAAAYRDEPECRFPSDPDAEFFPQDLERAADVIVSLLTALEEVRQARMPGQARAIASRILSNPPVSSGVEPVDVRTAAVDLKPAESGS